MSTRPDEQWITLAEAAKRLGKDPSTLRKHLAQKHFESRRTEQGWHLVPWLDVQAFYVELGGRLPGVSCARPVSLCNSQDSRESCTHDAQGMHTQESDARVRELEEALRTASRRNDELVERVLKLSEEVSLLSRTVVALLPAASSSRATPRSVTGAVSEQSPLAYQDIYAEESSDSRVQSIQCQEYDPEFNKEENESVPFSPENDEKKTLEIIDMHSTSGEWLSVLKAAERLAVTPKTVRTRVEKGLIEKRENQKGHMEVFLKNVTLSSKSHEVIA